MLEILNEIDAFVWGPPLLVLLVGTGILLTFRLQLLQVFKLPQALGLIFSAKNDGSGDLWQGISVSRPGMRERPRPPVKPVCSDFKPVARKTERSSERKKGVGMSFRHSPHALLRLEKAVDNHGAHGKKVRVPVSNCCQQLRKFIGRAV